MRSTQTKGLFCLMCFTDGLSAVTFSATGNLENHIVGGTSRMTAGCKKSCPEGWEISVPHSPEQRLLKIRCVQYCELIGTEESLPLPLQHMEQSTWFTKGLILNLFKSVKTLMTSYNLTSPTCGLDGMLITKLTVNF